MQKVYYLWNRCLLMVNRLIICLIIATAWSYSAHCQSQACPANINFATSDLSFWSAKTGLVNGSNQNYPAPNSGVSIIPEFSLNSAGIKVITTSSNDLYGGFPTVPTINGYAYNYSVLLGSTATSWDLHSSTSNPGGFTRAITYLINVPAGLATEPYTMTYAYAMVLENGTHNSNEQPLFKATLSVNSNVITCASPHYYLPTFNNAGGGSGSTGATLDSATAIANGFSNSPVLFLSHSGQQGNTGILLRDVWTKGWTEVTFDLSPYRGQIVTLTFEADNCTPGAHFAYAYVALRNTCAGLQISGFPKICANTIGTYSVPALAGANYSWTVPSGWSITSGDTTNIISVSPGANAGSITVRELNSCADLKDTIAVSVSPPTVAGQVGSDATVCSGSNTTQLTLNGSVGNILGWLSSSDGVQWDSISNHLQTFTAQNLLKTTLYRALVQNGSSCRIDTSVAATVTVDPRSVGGSLSPANTEVCIGQTVNSNLRLSGNTGPVFNWQQSFDKTTWNSFSPAKKDSAYGVNSLNSDTYYRVIVKSGVCPADTSSIATLHLLNANFPAASFQPDSAFICYGQSARLNATISSGTSYTWTPVSNLINQGNGTVTSLPYNIQATASPSSSTYYILKVFNAVCPTALTDTFLVRVAPRIIVNAGHDTIIVSNQQLQFNATVNDPAANQFNWSPPTGLSATNIPNPVALLNSSMVDDAITYIVRATNSIGCYGEDAITVRVFKTGPDIFVPDAFTPNGDGHNDVIRPILVGIKQLNFFRVYNRWGQLIFQTSESEKGWDGKISGQDQTTNSFVYYVQAVDYTGRVITKKGTFTLIR
ncbi:MAG: T9SS type B sorting domain-containing protein [Flavisolibacter sp.]